jgi:hypothetical protein
VGWVLACAVASLALGAWALEGPRLHLTGLENTLNDQVGYISVARTLVETGRLESQILMPSLMAQGASRNYLYMPGHYWALAASYALLGERPYTWLVPSWLAYLVAASSVWLAARRLAGPLAAARGAALFLAFPALALYAQTAMAEVVLVASATLALCAFLHLRVGLRPWLGAPLVLLPFLVRETAALLALPMACVLLSEPGQTARRRLGRAAAFMLLATVLCLAVYSMEFSLGRPSLVLINLLAPGEESVYGRAFAVEGAATPARILDGFVRTAARNLGDLWSGASLQALEGVSLLACLLAGAVCLVQGWRRRNSDLLPLGMGCFVMLHLLIVLGLYLVPGYRGLRMLLLAWPLAAVALASTLAGRGAAVPPSPRRAWLLGALIVCGVGLLLRTQRQAVAGYDALDELDRRVIEELAHDDSRVLVAPWWMSMSYVLAHHPVKFSFLPVNDRSLALLAQRHPVGTLILPAENLGTQLTREAVSSAGLRLSGSFDYQGHRLLVFRSPARD